MKVVVFAHVPPPHHGQSQMVQLMVEGFRADPSLGVEVLHVDARLSADIADVGSARGGKIQALLGYCREARRFGREHGCRTLYYIPSPPKRNSLYRDFIALARLRGRFDRVIFHWHAVGLGGWLETEARWWERWLAHRLLGRASMGIALAETNRADAAKFSPKRIAIVSNGIPDPCPDFAAMLAKRRTGLAARDEVNVLFLAHCTREKGLFDAVEAVVAANREGRRKFRLRIAGGFMSPVEEAEFRARIARPDAAECIRHVGFVSGLDKDRLFRESDVFLFPTYFANEGQPLNLIEAFAYGLPCVTTRWRAIPEYFSAGYPGLCEPRDVPVLTRGLHAVAGTDGGELRAIYERRFAVGPHLRSMAAAIRSAE